MYAVHQSGQCSVELRTADSGVEAGIDWRHSMNSFFEQVYAIVEQIPHGKVISYGQIARMLGQPRAACQVGWRCGAARKICSGNGSLWLTASITGGMHAEVRRGLLEAEGVKNLYSQLRASSLRVFFRPAASVFLGIHKVFPRKTSLLDEKIPRQADTLRL